MNSAMRILDSVCADLPLPGTMCTRRLNQVGSTVEGLLGNDRRTALREGGGRLRTAPETVIRSVLLSTLYPSSVRPNHGVFVENRLREAIASGGVETRVVAPVPWFPSRAERFGRYALFARTPKNETHNSIDVSHPRYLLPPRVGMSIAPVMLALGARRCLRKLIAGGFDFDLIDAHYYYPDGVAAAILARWLDKPFVITARGSDLNVLPQYRFPRSWIRWAHARAAASLFVSDALRREMVAIAGPSDRHYVVRNGVDLDRFSPRNREQCKQELGLEGHDWVLFVGQVSRNKGVQHALAALPSLPANVRLAVVGDGPHLAEMRETAASLGVGERVRFVGSVAHENLPTWYSAASVLALLSKSEGTPNVILESLACGTPVVATGVGGVPEVVESPVAGTVLTEPGPDRLAAAIAQLIDEGPDTADVRGYAARFGWEASVRAQLDIFNSVIGSA